MRIQIPGKPGYVVADLVDHGNAVDLSIMGPGGWQGTRMTMRGARKLAAELVRMTARSGEMLRKTGRQK